MDQSEFERQVMEKILAGGHPSLAALRRQYQLAQITGRDFTGAGFFTYFSVPPTAPRVAPARLQLSDLHVVLSGSEHGAGVLLFVDEGVLETLEVYMWAEDWPTEPEISAILYLQETPHADGRGYDLKPVTERDPAALGRGLRT